MSAILAYQFDEDPVRIVMVAGDPWFVANDICRVLNIGNPRQALARLDEDERGVSLNDTLGGVQEMNIISESGMYALVLGSRKAEARRFRKWVTSDVLPELRRTGKYQLHDHEPPPQVPSDFDPPRMMASVAVVREGRRLFGPRAARSIWKQLGLPVCIADARTGEEGDPLAAPLQQWLQGKTQCTIEEAANGIGIDDPDQSVRNRIGVLLRMFGWSHKTVRRGHATVRLFRPAASMAIEGGDE